MSVKCCRFRPGVTETDKNENIERCAWHQAFHVARKRATGALLKMFPGLLPSDLTGGALVFTGARWVRYWRYEAGGYDFSFPA